MNKREAMNVAWNVRVNGLDMWLGRKEDKEQIKAALRWFEEAARSWPEAIGYECTTTEEACDSDAADSSEIIVTVEACRHAITAIETLAKVRVILESSRIKTFGDPEALVNKLRELVKP